MRNVITLVLAAWAVIVSHEAAQAQCQRGMRSQSGVSQPTSFAQREVNPMVAARQAALQQQMAFAASQQFVAFQQLRRQQLQAQLLTEQERQARKRRSAVERRAALLAKRERIRAENLARRNQQNVQPDSQTQIARLAALNRPET